ncbi:ketosteroid isomerase-like protein [Rhizobium sp. BK512]|nr:ketosteroid isomerase-like protein [Rhizobium sp. BK379]MBB3562754.1 ketosteroid isomerase-like protein [Rhizobium sp. BK512]
MSSGDKEGLLPLSAEDIEWIVPGNAITDTQVSTPQTSRS